MVATPIELHVSSIVQFRNEAAGALTRFGEFVTLTLLLSIGFP
jgi:hypothetical protein